MQPRYITKQLHSLLSIASQRKVLLKRACSGIPLLSLVLFSTVLFSISSTAHAELVGTWRLEGKRSLQLAVAGEQTRLDVDTSNTLLVTPAKAYLITRQGDRRVAMDLEQISGMLSIFGGVINQQVEQAAGGTVDGEVKLIDTGREETVAGYPGRVFLIRRAGQADQELVLGKDPKLVKLQQAYSRLGARLAQLVRNPELNQAFALVDSQAAALGYQGILRYQDRFVLENTESKALPASYFQVPAGTTIVSMPVFGN